MTDQELASLQEQMYRDAIEAPEEQEKMIIDTAQEVSKKLYFHPARKVAFEFLGRNYRATYTVRIVNFKKLLIFIAFDEERKNVPIRAEAEIENGLSELENLRATIAAFLRNRAGMDVAEELEEEDNQ